MSAEWFYLDGDTAIGPISSKALRELAESGKVNRSTAIRRGLQSEWVKAGRVKNLFPSQPSRKSDEGGESERDPLLGLAARAAGTVSSLAHSAATNLMGSVTQWVSRPPDATVTSPPQLVPSGWEATLSRDNQPTEIVSFVLEKVNGILMRDERVVYLAVQNKPVVNWKPDCIVLTNRRFILFKPKLFGRVDFEDYVWRDIHDAKLSENIIGSTITIRTTSGQKLSLDYLPKSQARAVYQLAQEQEEIALEDRRQRGMEEDRAKAGGNIVVQTHVGAASPTPSLSSATTDPLEQLKQLKKMLEADLISQAEFDSKKTEILSRM